MLNQIRQRTSLTQSLQQVLNLNKSHYLRKLWRNFFVFFFFFFLLLLLFFCFPSIRFQQSLNCLRISLYPHVFNCVRVFEVPLFEVVFYFLYTNRHFSVLKKQATYFLLHNSISQFLLIHYIGWGLLKLQIPLFVLY